MAYNEDDENLKKLFDRFIESEEPAFQSGANWPSERKNPHATDWRDSAGAFTVRCTPRHPQAPYTSPGLLLSVSQWIRKQGQEELWDSVIVRCDEETDGTMTVRVIVSNPGWEHRLQIACIRSRPGDQQPVMALACNFDHEEMH